MKRTCVHRNNNVRVGVRRRFREVVWLISQVNCQIRKSSGFPSSNEHFKGEQVNSNKVS